MWSNITHQIQQYSQWAILLGLLFGSTELRLDVANQQLSPWRTPGASSASHCSRNLWKPKFHAVFTRIRHLPLSWPRWIQSVLTYHTFLGAISVYFLLRQGLPVGCFPSAFPNKTPFCTVSNRHHTERCTGHHSGCNKTGNVLYVYRNIEARSFNHCYSGKAMSITYSDCVFVCVYVRVCVVCVCVVCVWVCVCVCGVCVCKVCVVCVWLCVCVCVYDCVCVCVCVALGIHHAIRMRPVVICDLSRSATFFHIIS